MHSRFYKLMKHLSKPSKVASTLDWKKFSGATLLSLNIHRDRIGIAISSHPSLGEKCHELEPLFFADDHITIDKKCMDRFEKIIEEYKVCGIVVSWPLQRDTGKMGAACGRVLYALEEIIDKGSVDGNVFSPSRPLCLWDSGHITPKQREDPRLKIDSFGRCASYSNISDKKEYRGSEQYHEDELTVVCQVWEDFCKEHWPELFRPAQEKEAQAPDLVKTKKKTKVSRPYGTSRIPSYERTRTEQTPHQNTIKLLDPSVAKTRSLVRFN